MKTRLRKLNLSHRRGGGGGEGEGGGEESNEAMGRKGGRRCNRTSPIGRLDAYLPYDLVKGVADIRMLKEPTDRQTDPVMEMR